MRPNTTEDISSNITTIITSSAEKQPPKQSGNCKKFQCGLSLQRYVEDGRRYLLSKFRGLVEFVCLWEEKPNNPEDEEALQNQVIRRSLRKTFRCGSFTTHFLGRAEQWHLLIVLQLKLKQFKLNLVTVPPFSGCFDFKGNLVQQWLISNSIYK